MPPNACRAAARPPLRAVAEVTSAAAGKRRQAGREAGCFRRRREASRRHEDYIRCPPPRLPPPPRASPRHDQRAQRWYSGHMSPGYVAILLLANSLPSAVREIPEAAARAPPRYTPRESSMGTYGDSIYIEGARAAAIQRHPAYTGAPASHAKEKCVAKRKSVAPSAFYAQPC